MQRFYSISKTDNKTFELCTRIKSIFNLFSFFRKNHPIDNISVIVVHGIGEKTSLIIAKRNNNGLEIKAGNGRSIIFFCIV